MAGIPPPPPPPPPAPPPPAPALAMPPLRANPKWGLWWSLWSYYRGSSSKPIAPLKPTDAIRNTALRARFTHFLDHTDPPASFSARHVAQELRLKELREMGYEVWEDVMPAVIELAFELREAGYCEILKGGKVLGDDVGALDIEGSVRIRRVDD